MHFEDFFLYKEGLANEAVFLSCMFLPQLNAGQQHIRLTYVSPQGAPLLNGFFSVSRVLLKCMCQCDKATTFSGLWAQNCCGKL